jgi:SNF2 family DNA or RNA helicase
MGELWSLFEFLNPGMLGSASAFQAGRGIVKDAGEPSRELMARALRPFILRRTKSQVAPDLPAKTEQTLTCELKGRQRTLYRELLQHYRGSLLSRVRRDGLSRSKIHVLEALLRLRQAACHPGLIDRRRAREESAKLDLLFSQLEEVLDEGHKVLVFSQFTSLLALVKSRLDDRGISYSYLDGAMAAGRRKEAIRRFQEEAGCPLFLLSLRAGGYGLNLTAAGYVYLLDPWWNPAVEAQAIDRTHRIGQTHPVFAYRIVATGTIEEKILELQASKRRLAESILSADSSLMRTLTREDLELLLS